MNRPKNIINPSPDMKTLKRLLPALAAVLVLNLTPASTLAQERPDRGPGGPGGFDPEQMRARMMERYRDALEIKNDDEWKVIQPLIQKVSDARRAMGGGFGGFGGPGRGGRRGPGGDTGGDRRGGMFGEPNPEAEALQKSIEAKASAEELKAKLAKYRESQKAKQAALTAAQEELRKVLTLRQEASSVMMGLLQ